MIRYQKRVLDNGLTVVVEQDKSTALTAVNVLYKVGSKNEDDHKTGIAHLFEHLMFEGSANAPDFDTPLQLAGGENNAFTNNDYTNFYDLLPASNIETALWLEADRMAHLNISEQSLDLQKKVVIEEFKEVCLNKPYGDNWHHLSALAYKDHPYRWPTIGKETSHISAVTLDDIHSFYNDHYSPSNAVLAVSGPLDHDKVFELAEKWFGDIKKRNPTRHHLPKQEPLQRELRYKRVEGKVPLPVFLMGFHMPGRTDKDYYACDLLSDILSNGKSSRLYTTLVREKRIFTTVDCYISGNVDPGLIIIEGKPSEVTIEEGLPHVWQEISRISQEPPTPRELQKVKNKVLASIAMHDMSILNKAASLAYFECIGELDRINDQEELYNSLRLLSYLRDAI